MTVSAPARLARLLNLVPYLLARPGIELAEAAADLGVSDKQLREDLELLWVCGLPGYGPGDLIDMSFDGDRVTVTYDAGIDRPLRLTPDEATALVVALRMLAETAGTTDRDAVARALQKIEHAARLEQPPPVAVRLPGDTERLANLQDLLERGKALSISYYSAARDVTSERIIDPMRLLSVSGRSYVEAWCRSAKGVRMFRADRIDSITELEEPAAPPAGVTGNDLTDGVFQPDPQAELITLRVSRGSRWITEYYPCESVTEVSADEWLVSMRVNDMDWARRFVLGLGPRVQVVEPDHLAEGVRQSALAALANYA
ncbi:helix-turn-helix transcriptional regulator [Catelliglobosispora koreensis]|uniref:helix-turn-helix transcriptional regulator n=1 Tax=Catelliglobosispora koreensis TaxID=129052 RepID=UPI0003636DA7|nr:YafY family protein [Catelliglobosispora koreensis]